MEKSYQKLARRNGLLALADAVDSAERNLRSHSSRRVLCSRCENDREDKFKVTDIDDAGIITEVKCQRCKETSYICHNAQCYCRINADSNLENSYVRKLRDCHATPTRRKSVRICGIMDSVFILLSRGVNVSPACSCSRPIYLDPKKAKVTGVDKLGFITRVECPECNQQLNFSPFEASYVVQMLYCGRSDQAAVIQKAMNGDHVRHIDEVCNFLRRHSFYDNSLCPEFEFNDRECCRVTAIDDESGQVTEVEFVVSSPARVRYYNQRLQITCRSGCYYGRRDSTSKYELTYKAEMRKRLLHATADQAVRPQEAILSCTVLAANASILRRHNIDNKLCQNCENDRDDFLEVVEVDCRGFITRVQCANCQQSSSTACHQSCFYYEEIGESAQLQRGDHICWHRSLAYWHHAVVASVDSRTVDVVHYTSRGLDLRSVMLHSSTKNRREMSPSVWRGTAYRITYDDCYTNEYAALRAERCVGEKRYNVFNRNCEHTSHWCKKGLSESDQMKTYYSSAAKTALSFSLRLLNVLLLIVFQVVHESREGVQIDRKAFERYERIHTGAYMLVVFLLFVAWSLYTECKKLKPTHSNKLCCNRPVRVGCGLVVRIVARDLCAAFGPFMLLMFEDGIIHPERPLWERQFGVILLLLIVAIVSYVFGAVIGSLLENTVNCFFSSSSSIPAIQHNEQRPRFHEDP